MNILAVTAYCAAGCNSGSPGGESMHVLACDCETGRIEIVKTVRGVQGTTYFALSGDGGMLYSIVRLADPPARRSAVVAFPVLPGGNIGRMRTVAELPCEAPCHISLSPDGRRLGFAAYTSATAGTVDLAGGKVASVVHSDELKGPNAKRQDKAHAHCAFFTPDGTRLGVVDLGLDRIFFYEPGTMRRDDSMTVATAPGLGPRHVVFSRDGRFMFVVHELGSAVSSYAFDGRSFRLVCTKSTLPAGWSGETKAAAIKLTDDGSLLMASNRGHDSIAFFAVDAATGDLEPKGIAPLKGRFPRDFQLMPGERFMIVGHKMSDEIQVYRFDRESCSLEPAGDPVKAWKPLCFVFTGRKEGRNG